MLLLGLNITSPGDKLQPISIDRFFQGIQDSKQTFKDQISQLRSIATMDINRYRDLKKKLPYVVCGMFHPLIRRKENFSAIQYFIIDMDHIVEHGKSITTITDKLRAEPQVHLFFKSPGGDGIKVMFKLKENCHDAQLFSAFYKIFGHYFGEKTGLMDIIDIKTSDVTRACFMSYDEDAFYNAESECIDMNEYLNKENIEQVEKSIKEIELKFDEQVSEIPKISQNLEQDVLDQIKAKLNPRVKTTPEKQFFVPKEVDNHISILTKELAELSLELYETEPIQYGRKVRIKTGRMIAEINIFYGKRGFTVVKTNKAGTNESLADVAARAIEQILKPEFDAKI
ncbi:MAG: CRISPR-associated primase-polymerase type B [Saprospiraceae bacterium]|nr:CRISPR-associated primase-polymerase type B [Saprospiraceae bacterium]